MKFTQAQQKVIDARGRNILVSAAAGSGKTAVLVERIIREITEGETPLDVDRLLVVTFTRAAAAQMRERIAAAIAERLEKDPENRHLQRQETLLHHAQITTIDSFCTFLLRNNFGDIGLDPGFRQMDEMETELLRNDTLEALLEEMYAEGSEAFHRCVEYFCPDMSDRALGERILALCRQAESHPWPAEWLRERERDYDCKDAEELLCTAWTEDFLLRKAALLEEYDREYDELIRLSLAPGGPYPYEEFLRAEKEQLFGGVRRALAERGRPDLQGRKGTPAEENQRLWEALSAACTGSWDRIPAVGRNNTDVEPERKGAVQGERDRIKKSMQALGKRYFGSDPGQIAAEMAEAAGPLRELLRLAGRFMDAFHEAKRERNVIDFDDLEHFALQILTVRDGEGGVHPSRAAQAYQQYFYEILIDEYQDSNDVQELMLRMISREEQGQNNRFMVGDVKQSIYKFRLARPEIFMEKYASYRPDDPRTERIDLDRNFRSRLAVLDTVNSVFERIMRPEIGGIRYDEYALLRHGASYYPGEPEDTEDGRPQPHSGEMFETEFWILDQKTDSTGSENGEEGEEDDEAESGDVLTGMNAKRREALMIAQRIRRLTEEETVTDAQTGELRRVRFKDIVILLRSAASWEDEFREVFEAEGIPCHIVSRAGYFAADEIRTLIQLLRALDNLRQDIPLYGVMRGFFGGFDEEECALIRAACREGGLSDALEWYASAGERAGEKAAASAGETGGKSAGETDGRNGSPDGRDPALSEKCRRFLMQLGALREKLRFLSVHELLEELISGTGYEDYVRALPGGAQRAANLSLFMSLAADFEKTSYSGLFHFLRYLDQMHQREVDMGEANILDENADVVRLMTVHKSKGLEFPICFLAGTSRKINTRDASGALLCDSRWGIGIDWCDTKRRISSSTFRKEVIADHIVTDSLGEELRVLYVALTRAKEKLIITGSCKNYETEEARRELRIAAAVREGQQAGEERQDREDGSGDTPPLPVSLLLSARSYYDFLLYAAEAARQTGGPVPLRIVRIDGEELEIAAAGEQDRLFLGQRELDAAERMAVLRGAAGLPDPELARRLTERFSRRYAHEELHGLYTKTTVTELKRAAGKRLWSNEESAAKAQEGRFLFPTDRTAGDGGGGAARGTVIHRGMERLDYRVFAELGSVTKEDFLRWRASLEADGSFTPEEAELLTPEVILPFLHSPLCARMAAAERAGVLCREQPFVMGLPASRIDPQFPEQETMLIQGIIDAFFVEDGRLIIVDYKTDHVRRAEELTERYRIQLDYYAEALSAMLEMETAQKLIWSFALECEAEVP
ncbi:helicase-exonuclease AddAB subunit AddA [Lachnoclostridium sp. Marseille-P6806]|uniref:helicase-exonuclease AddAB subunit AddA n=1 Tax=Lachnoclostridium sp. Marseille-P6806 TaxID=2364793 RepID=UPI0013EF44A2|nr:helicase-exonuclease AddAB subunit AddA [Lachnoclostridium sp. Marseille-P6806]